MVDKTPQKLARIVRPLLCEMAEKFDLSKGILGIAISIPKSRQHVYFAEFVGSIRSLDEIEDEELSSQNYVLSTSNVLSACLWENKNAPARLSKSYAQTTEKEIRNPITFLFDGEDNIPDVIKIYRKWFKQRHSLIYFIPRSQESEKGWSLVSRSAFLVAQVVRSALVIAMAAEEVERCEVEAILESLPEHLPDHERRVRALLEEIGIFREKQSDDVRKLRVLVDYIESRKCILFQAQFPDREPQELFQMRGTLENIGSGKEGLLCFIGRKHRISKQVLAFMFLRTGIARSKPYVEKKWVKPKITWHMVLEFVDPTWSMDNEIGKEARAITDLSSEDRVPYDTFVEKMGSRSIRRQFEKRAVKTTRDRMSKRIKRANGHFRQAVSKFSVSNGISILRKTSKGEYVVQSQVIFTDDMCKAMVHVKWIEKLLRAVLTGKPELPDDLPLD